MKKRIIIFIGSLQTGGAERVVSLIASYLTSSFSSVEIVTYYNFPIFYEISPRVKITSLEDETHTKSILKNMKWFRSYVKRNNPDIVLSFLSVFNILSFFALLHIKVKLIACERSDPRYSPRNPFLKIIRNVIYNYVDGIVFQTCLSQNYFPRKIGKKGIVIANPCSIGENLMGKALTTPKKRKIVSVCRLIKTKNLNMLISAFSVIQKRFPLYELNIYGEGDSRRDIEEMIERLSLSDAINLRGNMQDVHQHILDAEIFVLSSNYEGMPNSLMEAMALGLPVISTRVAGTNELIDGKENGILINIGDEKGLVEALIQLIENPDLRYYYGKNAKEQMKNYRKEIILDRWNGYLQHIIND